jgi:hypothetical protein
MGELPLELRKNGSANGNLRGTGKHPQPITGLSATRAPALFKIRGFRMDTI